MGRTHKPRRRHIPKRIELDTIGLAHARASLLLPEQRRDLVDPMQQAFVRMRTGHGERGDWCNLADALNVAERLAALGIASDRAGEIADAQAALAAVHTRHAAGGSYTLRGAELAALHVALEFADVQLEVCTQGELAEAITTVQRCISQALAGNASPSAQICTGALGANPTNTGANA